MFSNAVVTVNGRQALPLRAIPYVTAWEVSPDSLVRVLVQPTRLKQKGCEYANTRALVAYGLQRDGHICAVSPEQWRHIENELNCSTKKLKADERPFAEGENHAPWRFQAVLALPQNCFVWLDEFLAWFAKTRPLLLPTDDEVAQWESAQAEDCDATELASVLADGMPLTCQSLELQLDVILPAAVFDKLWVGVAVIADEPQPTQVDKPLPGRPRTVAAKIKVLQVIVEAYIKTTFVGVDPGCMPGTVAGVLAACQKIEKANNPNQKLFNVATFTFKRYLAGAGYRMSPGKKSDHDKQVWQQHAAEIAAKIPSNTFCFK